MTATDGRLVLLDPNGNEIHGKWSLDGEDLAWEVLGSQQIIPSGDDLEREVKRVVSSGHLGTAGERYRLKACCTCKHFGMSGMARDMGRGQRGVCKRHKIGVEICFLCIDYESRQVDENVS